MILEEVAAVSSLGSMDTLNSRVRSTQNVPEAEASFDGDDGGKDWRIVGSIDLQDP